MASNVNLIDPNDINTKNLGNNNINAIPQYQDMYIFVELKAKRRGRSVIITSSEGNIGQGFVKTGLEEPKEINLLGIDQNNDPKNPNYLKFTTNYYDGSTGTYTQYESFGITNIKITVNSSYVPTVNIQFVDVRGLSFFNQENSPYRILFDFPPPIFELSIKGYYGKALKYLLHLVKYTTEFNSQNGNFVIDANFVALTFAPLSDVLFRYIVNGALMNYPQTEISPSTSNKPTNTFMLITQLKNLYTSVTEKVKSDAESREYDRTKFLITKIGEIIDLLNGYRENPDIFQYGTSYLITKTKNTDKEENYSISQTLLSDYDQKIKLLSTNGIPEKLDDRLYIVLPVQYNTESLMPSASANTITNQQFIELVKGAFLKYKDKIVNTSFGVLNLKKEEIKLKISEIDFNNYFNLTKGIVLDKTTRYVGLDITDLYLSLYKEKFNLETNLTELSTKISTKINNMVNEKLGMEPSIYNIFKIILDDVDNFFEKLKKVSKEAEENHHNDEAIKKIILGSGYKDITDKIYAFPLVVDTEKIVCGGNKEERIAPINLSKKLTKLGSKPFPEIEFVNNFIETFFTQARLNYLANMRENQNSDGSNEWIPISPIDSKLGNLNAKSPYYNIDNPNIVNTSEKNKISQILDIMLNRFYVLSQFAIPDNFYPSASNNKVLSEYIKMYATSEAINLATSIINSTYTDSVNLFANKYKDNINDFYVELEKQIPETYSFKDNTKIYIENVASEEPIYVDKTDPNYKGLELYFNRLDKQTINQNSERPIDKFKRSVRRSGFSEFFKGTNKEVYYQFTNENVLLISDKKIDKQGNESTDNIFDDDNNNLITRYLIDVNDYFNTTQYKYSIYKPQFLLNSGNTVFASGSVKSVKASLNSFQNIVDVWSKTLSNNIRYDTFSGDFDDIIYPDIINNHSKLSALFILSNFGSAIGAFNKYPNNYNDLIFGVPAAIEIPRFLCLYIGALVNAYEEYWIKDVIDYFTGGSGQYIYDRSLFIFADYFDVNEYLSYNDKQLFKNEFLDFYQGIGGEYSSILSYIKQLYDDVKNDTENKKEKAYKKRLDPKDNSNIANYYNLILKPLIERSYVINFSQYTFKMEREYPSAYQSLKTINTNANKKKINDSYFSKFLSELYSQIQTKKRDAEKKEVEEDKKKNDIDIITQTYYSFKNINDKWLTNPTDQNIYGYPFNRKGKRLIDSFIFVDRAMNPIGNDTMINAEMLIDLLDDPNTSIFSVLSSLLSANGFEFFPLQNFMVGETEWEECFKIDTSGEIENTPAFVCMYIGGTSSYPTTVQNGFTNDGIEDLSLTDASDFSTQNCTTNSDGNNQITEISVVKDNFPYHRVNAFRVRFGEQNQSMFSEIKIDSKEYPETNESIQILSRLAGDNKEHAIPKGQNLYNLYENRAYKATVTGLGNLMIQPTQYFQLENIPLFNGAYIILSVEHNLTENKLITSFSGTKILKYPVPRVTSPLAFMGFDGGESYMTNIKEMSAGQLVAEAVTISNARLEQLNSVFGVDVSHHQDKINWDALANPTYEDDPKPKFAFIKVTQGNSYIDKMAKTNAISAQNAGLKIGYYHYAEQYTGNDVVNDAKGQAQHFLKVVSTLPKPNFPLVLDFENDEVNNKFWSKNKANNDLWINTFISELKSNGHDVILYGGKYTFEDYTSSKFENIPLWHAQYLQKPEINDPKIARGWNDWAIWQFSSNGRLNGHGCRFDINAMRKYFYEKYA